MQENHREKQNDSVVLASSHTRLSNACMGYTQVLAASTFPSSLLALSHLSQPRSRDRNITMTKSEQCCPPHLRFIYNRHSSIVDDMLVYAGAAKNQPKKIRNGVLQYKCCQLEVVLTPVAWGPKAS
jgi:hypothetical protein